MRNKYIIIGIYFGNLRADFPLWLKSCSVNNDIDFLLVTDALIPPSELPSNVKYIKTTLEEIRILGCKKLGYEINLMAPYKLCDFKPAFGIILDDYLKGYEYWGHCDFDMLFGRISFFLKKYEINKYIHFLTQGHLSFYKNRPEVTDYMYLSGAPVDAKLVFSSNRNFAFDENYGIGQIYIHHNIPQFCKNIYADISPIYRRLTMSTYYNLDTPPINYPLQIFIWKNGITKRLYVENNKINEEEVIYIHYQKRPLEIPNITEIKENNIFILTPTKIIPWSGEITIKDIENLNPYTPWTDKKNYLSWKIKKQWRRVISKFLRTAKISK